ncbi:hypothetical protein F5X96DRAFT_152240 [Biscogniauxia mediterranea]|nr:hypothetical protein F5X96DRAFT_152240 [Biscogniauxia mediterranea]
MFQAAKTDCDQLLRIVETLGRANEPSRRWKSFRSALELMWEKHDIEELDVVPINFAMRSSRNSGRLSKRHEIQQQKKLDEIFFILDAMNSRFASQVASIKSPRPFQQNVTPVIGPRDIEDPEKQMAQVSLALSTVSKQQSINVSLDFD